MSKSIKPLTQEEKEEFENWLPTKEQVEQYLNNKKEILMKCPGCGTDYPHQVTIICKCGFNNSHDKVIKVENIDLINNIYKFAGSSKLVMGVKKLRKTAKIPTKAHETDAGWDLYADIDGEQLVIPRGEFKTITTGIALKIPNGYCGQIWDRSSYGVNGTTKLAGVIDASYRGEVKVVLYSINGKVISQGDKFAQILIVPVPQIELIELDELDDTVRGEGGFGSTGK